MKNKHERINNAENKAFNKQDFVCVTETHRSFCDALRRRRIDLDMANTLVNAFIDGGFIQEEKKVITKEVNYDQSSVFGRWLVSAKQGHVLCYPKQQMIKALKEGGYYGV